MPDFATLNNDDGRNTADNKVLINSNETTTYTTRRSLYYSEC